MKTLLWLLFLPGFLCNPNSLRIQPNSLVAWKGSCVLIPCQIGQYQGAFLRDLSLLWYFQPFYDTNRSDYSGQLLYNSSAASSQGIRTRSQSAIADRLMFVGNLERQNCSLKISQLRAEDNGTYGARLYASYGRPTQKNKWFLNATVNVAESPPEPRMDIFPKEIQEGQMDVTCSVPYHCLDEPLRLTISGLGSRLSSQPTTTKDGVIKTVVSFQVTWEDHGKYLVCSLLKTWDRPDISKSTMQLDVKYAPKRVQVKASPGTTIREGEMLYLECTVHSSNPEVTEYLWYKNDQRWYEQPNLNKISFKTKDWHSGAYKCEAKNSVGVKNSEELSIEVHYPPKEVKIEWLTQGSIKEGGKVVLKCSAKGNPPVTNYKWYKLLQTDVFQQSEWLQFDAIQLEDAGSYYCIANSSLGHSESSPVTLDVLYAPKDVQLAIENNQLPIRENDTVILNCSFSHSNPNNSIWYAWHRGKSKLSEQGNLLTFSAKLDQARDYSCEVCNSVKCVSSRQVLVDIHFAPQNVKVVQETRNPIREGNHVKLRCEVKDANPKVDSYRWYKDGVQQHPYSAPEELSIYHVTSAHSGKYWCEATNSMATSSSQQIVLNVHYGPRQVHLSLEREVAVTEGMDVSLLCDADANPPPHYFELYRDEEKLLERADRILLLQKVRIEDSGDYYCKAHNSVSAGESPTLMLSVSYSRATKLKHGMKGLGIILSLIFVLGMLFFALKAWKKKRNRGDARVQRSGSFFVRKPKPEQLCNNRAREGAVNTLALLNDGAEEAVSYAVLRFPPGAAEEQDDYARVMAPRVALDPSNEEAVYSVVKKPGAPSKGDAKHDYENVVAQKEEELHYSSLVNLAPRPRPVYRDSETDSELEESIQYAALKH